MNRKSANSNSANDSARCTHYTPSGRRCRMLVVGPGQLLCRRHTDELIKADGLNLREALLAHSQGLQTAQGINLALGNIFKLLAANYISARRASVLTFICSQLLRTLPAIDADNAAGIVDPTASEPMCAEPQPAAQPTTAFAPPPPESPAQPSTASTEAAPHISTSPANLASAKPAPVEPSTNHMPSTNIVSPSPHSNPAPPRIIPPSTSAVPSTTQPATSKSGPHLTVVPTKAAPPIAGSPRNPVSLEPDTIKKPS